MNDQIQSEQMSQSELHHLENVKKDDELHFLQTLINMNKLAGKITVAMKDFYKLLETSAGPQMMTDSRVENQRKLLRVKSDHQLFLIKDITQHVTKILNDAKITKEEFGFIYEFLSKENELANQDNVKLEKVNQLMEDMGNFITHLEQLFHELIDRSITIIENGDLVENNYARLLKIADDRGDHQQKITELHELNEEHQRTILKLRKDLKDMKNSKPNSVPVLSLEKVHNQSRFYNVVNTIPKDEQERVMPGGIVEKSLKSENNVSLVHNESKRN